MNRGASSGIDLSHPRRSVDAFKRQGDIIGNGTFGDVWIARDQDNDNRLVAVKRLKGGGAHASQKGLELLRDREVKILSCLKGHPNIITLLELADPVDMTRESGVLYLIMERASHDLRGVMENKQWSQWITQGQVKGWIQQCLTGLAYCHSRHIMHRDLKPENILLTGTGYVKLADFGLARDDNPERYHKYTNPVVTRWYRAPELFLGATKYTKSIDTWSMGVIAAEFLLNSVLFPSRNDDDYHHLELIWAVCGTPLENGWPDAASLPKYRPFQPKPRSLVRVFQTDNKSDRRPYFTDGAVQLIDALTRLDPKKRISCEDALKMPYFTSEAFPAYTPEMMPRYKDSFFARSEKKRKVSEK